jgi:hypothetical protein
MTSRFVGLFCHEIGSLFPSEGDPVPKFTQLYIYDTQNELDHRMGIFGEDDESASNSHSAAAAQSSSAIVGRRRVVIHMVISFAVLPLAVLLFIC